MIVAGTGCAAHRRPCRVRSSCFRVAGCWLAEAGFADGEEFRDRAIDDATEVGFVAVESARGAALDGEGLPCERETGGFVGGGEVLVEGLVGAVHLEIDGGGSDGGEAFELPLGVGERGDEFEFGDGLGLPLGFEVFEVLESYFSFFSHQRTTLALLSPCFMALRAEMALPSAVFGPWDFWPLRRDASFCASVRELGIKKGPSLGPMVLIRP